MGVSWNHVRGVPSSIRVGLDVRRAGYAWASRLDRDALVLLRVGGSVYPWLPLGAWGRCGGPLANQLNTAGPRNDARVFAFPSAQPALFC